MAFLTPSVLAAGGAVKSVRALAPGNERDTLLAWHWWLPVLRARQRWHLIAATLRLLMTEQIWVASWE